VSTELGDEEIVLGSRIRTDDMAPDEFNRYNGCIKKIPYTNERKAEKVRRKMQQEFGGQWCTYPCPYCFQIHVGSVSERYADPYSYRKNGAGQEETGCHLEIPFPVLGSTNTD